MSDKQDTPEPEPNVEALRDELLSAACLLETLSEDLPDDDISGVMMRVMAQRNRKVLDGEAPAEPQMTGWVYDPDHPMSDGNDTRMTAAEEVLAYLLVEVNGSPDDVPYSPNEAQRILEDRLKEGRRLETDYADFLGKRRAALAAPASEGGRP